MVGGAGLDGRAAPSGCGGPVTALAAGCLLACALLVLRPPAREPVGRSAARESLGRKASRRSGDASERDGPDRRLPLAVTADLVVALLHAGLPTAAALHVLRVRLREAALEEPADLSVVTDALDLAEQTGVAPGVLVRAAAGEHRRREASRLSVSARRLGILVLIPTGVCLLPAFVVLTVVPLVLGLLSGAG